MKEFAVGPGELKEIKKHLLKVEVLMEQVEGGLDEMPIGRDELVATFESCARMVEVLPEPCRALAKYLLVAGVRHYVKSRMPEDA
jgi:hypothetical protein